MLYASMTINIILLIFNVLPVPPLDGRRAAVALLPRPLAAQLARLERVGFVIILAVLFILPLAGEQIGIDLKVFKMVGYRPCAISPEGDRIFCRALSG